MPEDERAAFKARFERDAALDDAERALGIEIRSHSAIDDIPLFDERY